MIVYFPYGRDDPESPDPSLCPKSIMRSLVIGSSLCSWCIKLSVITLGQTRQHFCIKLGNVISKILSLISFGNVNERQPD